MNMTVQTHNSRDKHMTNSFLYLYTPLYIRVLETATIEWE